MQEWGFLGGQRKRELSFAGPLFSTRPKNLQPTCTPTTQLPPRPTNTVAIPPQPSQTLLAPTKDTAPLTRKITKTRKFLLTKVKNATQSFLGKYLFGKKGTAINVLPLPITTPPTHRDLDFFQGKYTMYVATS